MLNTNVFKIIYLGLIDFIDTNKPECNIHFEEKFSGDEPAGYSLVVDGSVIDENTVVTAVVTSKLVNITLTDGKEILWQKN